LLRRAKKVIEGNGDVDKAIFVYDKERKNWKGKHTLYQNRCMDEMKSDTPEYSGCKPIGEILV
jgi:hypothetical protein